MGFVAQFRSSLENPQTPLSYPAEWLLDIFNGGRTDSGVRVSEMTALQVTTVFACVQLVSSALGFLPAHTYERILARDKRPAKRMAVEHDLYDLIRSEPNDEMTAFTFRKSLQCHAMLWGNLYAEIQRDRSNGIVALWPRNPARTRPYRLAQKLVVNGDLLLPGTLVYKTTEGMDEQSVPDADVVPDTPERVIAKEDMLHIPGLALDGRLGHSVVQLSRQAIGLALATERFGGKFFGNGARPFGVLQHPVTLKKPALENLKRSVQEAWGGENVLKPMILEEGMVWKETSTKPNEGQFLETREFQVAEICRIFGVPPHMVADTAKQNRANTEQIGLEFVTFSLAPWLESWQQELKRKLFPKVGRAANKYFVKFETRQMTMPDAASKRDFYATVRQWGIGSSNDIRELEDWNPIDDPAADALWKPVNMEAVGTETEDTGETERSVRLESRFVKAYFRVFRDAFGRIVARSAPDSSSIERIFMPVLSAISDALVDTAALGEEAEAQDNCTFLREYLSTMSTRVEDWKKANGDADQVAERELSRAVRAIWIEVNRSLAIVRAKKQLEEVHA